MQDVIIIILIATTPDLAPPDAAALVLVVGSAFAGFTAMAYTARLNLDHFASTGSSSVTLLYRTLTAVYVADDFNAALMVPSVAVTTPAVTSTFITNVIAAVDNLKAVASWSEYDIAADCCYAVAVTAAFVASAAHIDVMSTITTIADNFCPENRLREG